MSVDPLYLDISASNAADWNVHVQTGSLLVGAGATDLQNPDTSTASIGAYGGPGAALWDLDHDGDFEWWQAGTYVSGNYPAAGWDCDDRDSEINATSGCHVKTRPIK